MKTKRVGTGLLVAALLLSGCVELFGGQREGEVLVVAEERSLERGGGQLASQARAAMTLTGLVVLGHAQESFHAGRMTSGRLLELAEGLNAVQSGLPERFGTLRAQAQLAIAEAELQCLEGPGGEVEAMAYRELVRAEREAEVVVARPVEHEDSDDVEASVGEEELVERGVDDWAESLDAPSKAAISRVLVRLDELEVPEAPSAAPVSSWTLAWPLEKVRVTSRYGMRKDPVKRRKRRMHRGTDLAGEVGTPVYAAGPGEVLLAGWGGRGTGNAVVIRHPGGVVTQYFHLSRVSARAGAWVKAGERIGDVGATGRVTGPHLHFQVAIGGEDANPEKVIGETFK